MRIYYETNLRATESPRPPFVGEMKQHLFPQIYIFYYVLTNSSHAVTIEIFTKLLMTKEIGRDTYSLAIRNKKSALLAQIECVLSARRGELQSIGRTIVHRGS